MQYDTLSLNNAVSTSNLSPHFTFQELTVTSKTRYKFLNSLLAKDYINNLILLANYILEPARAILNKPLIITSAYRCPGLNKEIGGSATSQHLYGTAADFIITTKYISLVSAFIKLKESPFINYGQLILEESWLHISLGAPFRPLDKCCENFRTI